MNAPEEDREWSSGASEVVGTALGYVSIILGVGALLLSPLFFASRLSGFFISFGIERLFLAFNREKIVFRIRSIRVALLGGKLVLEGFQYTTKDVSIQFSYGVITLRWWRWNVMKSAEDGTQAKSRLDIDIEGLEYLIFNNSAHFSRLQAILDRRNASDEIIHHVVDSRWKNLLKRIFQAIAPKSFNLQPKDNEAGASELSNLGDGVDEKEPDQGPIETTSSHGESSGEEEAAVLPSFFDVIPTVVVRIVAAAVMLGSEDLTKMAIITFKNGNGVYYKQEKAKGFHSYIWDFEIDRLRAYIAPDPRRVQRRWKQHFKTAVPKETVDPELVNEDEVQHSGGFSRKMIIETLALFKLYYRDMHFEFLGPDVYRTAASMGEGNEHYKVGGSDLETSLCRPEDGDDAAIECEDLLRCDSMELNDDPGVVSPNETEDILPKWGLDLVLKGEDAIVTYGPAHDRIRDEMMNIFLPLDYENWPIYKPVVGEERRFLAFQVVLTFEEGALVRLPFKALQKKGTTNSSPLEWATLHCGAMSTLSVIIPWEATSEEGTSKKIAAKLIEIEVFTSHEINIGEDGNEFNPSENPRSACIISSPCLDIDIDLETPIGWNDLAIWDFRLTFDSPQIMFLRAHLDLLFRLSADWSFVEAPLELATFVPAWYRFSVTFNQFSWYFNASDRNLVTDPASVESYPQVLWEGSTLKLGTVIQSDQFGKDIQEIPFQLDIDDLQIATVFPPESAPYPHLNKTPFLDVNSLGIAVKYRYFYSERVKPGEIDSVSFRVKGDGVTATIYGFSLRRMLGFVENYFGEYQSWAANIDHRHALEEACVNSNVSAPVRQFELRLSVSLTKNEVRLPLTLKETKELPYIYTRFESVGIEMRNTDTFMDVYITMSPVKFGSNGAIASDNDFHTNGIESATQAMFKQFGNERHCSISFDGISISMFHLYGPPPLYSLFRSKWRIRMGDIEGEVLPEQLFGLSSWWDHFRFYKAAYDYDREFDKILDIISLDSGPINIGIWTPAGLSQVYLQHGICVETDTLINSQYHEKILLLVPHLRVKHLRIHEDDEDSSQDDSESGMMWQELLSVDASLYVSLLDRYPNWSDDFDKQLEFLENNSMGHAGLLESLTTLSVRTMMENRAEDSGIPFVFELWNGSKDILWKKMSEMSSQPPTPGKGFQIDDDNLVSPKADSESSFYTATVDVTEVASGARSKVLRNSMVHEGSPLKTRDLPPNKVLKSSFDPSSGGLFPVIEWDPLSHDLPQMLDPGTADIDTFEHSSSQSQSSGDFNESTGYYGTDNEEVEEDEDGKGVRVYKVSYVIHSTRPIKIITSCDFIECIPSLAAAFSNASQAWTPAIPAPVVESPTDFCVQIPAIYLTVAQTAFASSSDMLFNAHFAAGDICIGFCSPEVLGSEAVPSIAESGHDGESTSSGKNDRALSYHESMSVRITTVQALLTMQKPRIRKYVSISTRPVLRVEVAASKTNEEVPVVIESGAVPLSMSSNRPVLVSGIQNVSFSSIEAKNGFADSQLSHRFGVDSLDCKNSAKSLYVGDTEVLLSMGLAPAALESLSVTWMTVASSLVPEESTRATSSPVTVNDPEVQRINGRISKTSLLFCGLDGSVPNKVEVGGISAHSIQLLNCSDNGEEHLDENSSDTVILVKGIKAVVDPSVRTFATSVSEIIDKLKVSASPENHTVSSSGMQMREKMAVTITDIECEILGNRGRSMHGLFPFASVSIVSELDKKQESPAKLNGKSTFVQLRRSSVVLYSDQSKGVDETKRLLVSGEFPSISAHLIDVAPRNVGLKDETIVQLTIVDANVSMPHPIWEKVQEINSFVSDWSEVKSTAAKTIVHQGSDSSMMQSSSVKSLLTVKSDDYKVPSIRETIRSSTQIISSRMRVSVIISNFQVRVQLLKLLAGRYIMSNATAVFEEEDCLHGSSKVCTQIQRAAFSVAQHKIMFKAKGAVGLPPVQEGVFNLPAIKATLADDAEGTRVAAALDRVHSIVTESMLSGLLVLQSSLQSDVDEVLTSSLDYVEAWKPQIPPSDSGVDVISVSHTPPKRFRVQAQVADFAVTLETKSSTFHVSTGPIDMEYDSVPQIDDISDLDPASFEKDVEKSETDSACDVSSEASGPSSALQDYSVETRTDSVTSFASSGVRVSTVGKGRYIIGRRHSHFDVRTTTTSAILAPVVSTRSGAAGPASFKSDLSSVRCGLRVTSFPQDLKEGWSSWGTGMDGVIPMAVATAAAADTEAWKASAGRLAQIWIMIEDFDVTVRPTLWMTAVNLMNVYEDALSKAVSKPEPVPIAKTRYLPPPTPARRLASKVHERSRSRIKYEAKRARSTDVSIYLFTKNLKVTFPIRSLNPEVIKAREARMLGISVGPSAANVGAEVEETCSLDLQWLAIRAHRLGEMRRIGAGDQRISVDIAALSLIAPEKPAPLAKASIRRIALRISMRQRVPIKILSYVGIPSVDIHATSAPVLFALLRDWETGLVAKTGQIGRATAEIIRTGTYGGEESGEPKSESSTPVEAPPVRQASSSQGINLDLTLRIGSGKCIMRAPGDRVSKRLDFGSVGQSESLAIPTPPITVRLQRRPRPLDDRSLSSAVMNISVAVGRYASIDQSANKEFVITITPTLVPFLETFLAASKKSETWAITSMADRGSEATNSVTDDRIELFASIRQKLIIRFQEGIDNEYSSTRLRCDVSMRDADLAYSSASRFNKHNPNVRLVMPTMLTMSLDEFSVSVRSPFFDHDSLNFGVVNVLGSYIPSIAGARPTTVGTALMAAQKIHISIAYHALSAVVDVLKMFSVPSWLNRTADGVEDEVDPAVHELSETVDSPRAASKTAPPKIFSYMSVDSFDLDISTLPSIGRFHAQIARASFRHSDQCWLAKASSDAAITCCCARRIYAGFIPGLLDAHLLIGDDKVDKHGTVAEKRASLSLGGQGTSTSGPLTMFYARRRAESFPMGDWTIATPPATVHVDYKRASILRLETVEISARIRDLTTELIWQRLLMGEIDDIDVANLRKQEQLTPVINAALFLRGISLSMSTRAAHEFGDISKIFGFVVSGFKKIFSGLVKGDAEETGAEMWLKRGILRDGNAMVTLSGVLDSHELALRTGTASNSVQVQKVVPEGTIIIWGSDLGVALFDKLSNTQCVYDHIDEFRFVLHENVDYESNSVLRSVDGTSMANFIIENRSQLASLGSHSQRQADRFSSDTKIEEVIGIPYIGLRSSSSQLLTSNEVYCDWESDFRGKPLRVKTVFALLNRVKNVHLKIGESTGKSSTTSGGGGTRPSSDGDFSGYKGVSVASGSGVPAKAGPIEARVYMKKNPEIPYAFPALPLKCVGEKVTLGELLNYLGVLSAEELVVATHSGLADSLSSVLFGIHDLVDGLRSSNENKENNIPPDQSSREPVE